jgi:hypothetical protein
MMRLTLLFSAFFLAALVQAQEPAALKTGDILFITNPWGQGKAIQLATHSKYTHVGVVIVENGKPYVYHAVEPVMKSTLDEFLAFSSDGKFVARRLKDPSALSAAKIQQMQKMAQALLGRHYDIYFNWKDDEWYCSEYVWKLYQRNFGLEIGKPRPLGDFDLSSDVVKSVMQKRYGKNIPKDEKMISPGDMFNSPLLVDVISQ